MPGEPGRRAGRILDAGSFRSDREAREAAGIVRPDPNPEPDDIGTRSREHDEPWQEHFRDEPGVTLVADSMPVQDAGEPGDGEPGPPPHRHHFWERRHDAD